MATFMIRQLDKKPKPGWGSAPPVSRPTARSPGRHRQIQSSRTGLAGRTTWPADLCRSRTSH